MWHANYIDQDTYECVIEDGMRNHGPLDCAPVHGVYCHALPSALNEALNDYKTQWKEQDNPPDFPIGRWRRVPDVPAGEFQYQEWTWVDTNDEEHLWLCARQIRTIDVPPEDEQ